MHTRPWINYRRSDLEIMESFQGPTARRPRQLEVMPTATATGGVENDEDSGQDNMDVVEGEAVQVERDGNGPPDRGGQRERHEDGNGPPDGRGQQDRDEDDNVPPDEPGEYNGARGGQDGDDNGGQDMGSEDDIMLGDGDNDDSDDYEDNYKDVLNSLSRQWMKTQLTHKVSAKASNTFWDLTLTYVPKLLNFKEREGHFKNIPKFINQRRKLTKQYCPDVQMEFAFRNRLDGSIIKHRGATSPLKEFQQNPNYMKLYEVASIKVFFSCYNTLFFSCALSK